MYKLAAEAKKREDAEKKPVETEACKLSTSSPKQMLSLQNPRLHADGAKLVAGLKLQVGNFAAIPSPSN